MLCCSPSRSARHPTSQSQALARDESHWSAWYGLGQVKGAQGKHAEAVEAFSKWLQGGGGGEGGAAKNGNTGSGAPEAEKVAGVRFMAKGLVQLGEAHAKLGQVNGLLELDSANVGWWYALSTLSAT